MKIIFVLNIILLGISYLISPLQAQPAGLFVDKAIELRDSSGQNDYRLEKIIQIIRTATEIYKDQKKAQAAGYRKFGPDMPNMGVHWINPGLAVNRIFDWEKPSTLTYLSVNGEPMLTGVAYTFPVLPGEAPPTIPVEEIEWHYHWGDLEKEAHGLHDHSTHRLPKEKARLAMIHAWVWAENPKGYFAADNWALSYLRLGIIPPGDLDPAPSMLLFMVDGGTDYLLRFAELASGSSSLDTQKMRNVFHEYIAKVKSILGAIEEQPAVIEQKQDELESLWISMWEDIKPIVGKDNWSQIMKHLEM